MKTSKLHYKNSFHMNVNEIFFVIIFNDIKLYIKFIFIISDKFV